MPNPPAEGSANPDPAPEPPVGLRPLRVWPAIMLLLGMVFFRALPGLLQNGPAMIWMSSAFGPALCGIGVLLWWVTASRAGGREKLAGFFGVILALVLTGFVVHPSLRGPLLVVLTIPMGTAGFALGAMIARAWPTTRRTWLALAMAVVAFCFSILLKTEGMWGNFDPQLSWRWTPTAEDALLAQREQAPPSPPTQGTNHAIQLPPQAEWPGFRGPERNSRQTGTRLATDWKSRPPKELWRITVGPGWSSFVVAGDHLFTQEQRGEDESVVCYAAASGKEIWTSAIKARFFDPLGGAGPRATPTLVDGRLFAQGAQGDLVCLNPTDGTLLWQQHIGRTAGREGPPMWGYSSSPLVAGAVVVVHAGGKDDKGVLAFDVASGKLQWSAPAGEQSYASPQLARIAGLDAILMTSDFGLRMLDPLTGAVILGYNWPHKGYRALQPQIVDEDTAVIPTGVGTGTRRIRITKTADGFKMEELWTSLQLKPDFNDFVIYKNDIYGFDGGMFACVDLKTGIRQWKGGRYGKGQVLLLADSGLLFVLGERGQGVLLEATPEAHRELASGPMLKGKTWNHPVVVGNRLYLRNADEAACYELPVVSAEPAAR